MVFLLWGVLLVLLSHCWSRWLLINKVCSPSVFFHSISSDLAQGSRLSSGENWIRIDWPVPSMRRPGQVTLTTPGENTTKVISLPTFCNYIFHEKKKYFLSFHVDSSISDICLSHSNCWPLTPCMSIEQTRGKHCHCKANIAFMQRNKSTWKTNLTDCENDDDYFRERNKISFCWKCQHRVVPECHNWVTWERDIAKFASNKAPQIWTNRHHRYGQSTT